MAKDNMLDMMRSLGVGIVVTPEHEALIKDKISTDRTFRQNLRDYLSILDSMTTTGRAVQLVSGLLPRLTEMRKSLGLSEGFDVPLTTWIFNNKEELKVLCEEQKSGCFVATACYGSPDCTEVLLLRQFRDEHLLRTSFGKWFVRFYCKSSPPLARLLWHHPTLRKIARAFVVAPAVRSLRLVLRLSRDAGRRLGK